MVTNCLKQLLLKAVEHFKNFFKHTKLDCNIWQHLKVHHQIVL